MLIFVVTVKPQALANDWLAYSKVVNRTLMSLTRQTSSAYRVVVVHDELPSPLFRHPKIDFVQLSRPIPRDHAEKNQDKAARLLAGVEHARRWPVIYVMPVDSDDLISIRLANFLEGQSMRSGWVSSSGYIWPGGWPIVLHEKRNLPDLCGSTLILRVDNVREFFPEGGTAYAGGSRSANLKMPPEAVWFDHQRVHLESGESLSPLPFPATVYSVLNGENIRATDEMVRNRTRGLGKSLDFISRLKDRPPRAITRSFQREFGLIP